MLHFVDSDLKMAESNPSENVEETFADKPDDPNKPDNKKDSSKKSKPARKKENKTADTPDQDKQGGKTGCVVTRTFDHPVFSKISAENGIINKMDVSELSRKLCECGLSNR